MAPGVAAPFSAPILGSFLPEEGRCWCVPVTRWPQSRPQRGRLSLSPVSMCVTVPVATEGTSVWLPVPVTRLAACQLVSGHGRDLSTAGCPHHPLACVSPSQGPQGGHLWLSPTSVYVTILVAAEGTSLWLPVAVTHLAVCHHPGGCGEDLSMAACPCHLSYCVSLSWWLQRGPQHGHMWPSPTSVCVSGLVAMEGTSVWPPVAITHLHVCQCTGGHGGDLNVAACPCHPSRCVSLSWWPQRGPRCS